MRVDLLSREYPPFVYGGAGVHVQELARVLRNHADVRVHCFDGPRTPGEPGGDPGVCGYADMVELSHSNPALKTLGVDLQIAGACEGSDLVHSHTWYANMAGNWASLLYDIPHVISAHSLEPLRPWKAEQLGGGYRLSSWTEREAYAGAAGIIAVSNAMREDILRCYPKIDPARVYMVHNGIDLEDWVLPSSEEDLANQQGVWKKYGVDPSAPTVVFVGRITRQKGLPYLLRALRHIPPEAQIILCAGAPDTPQIAAEVDRLVDDLRQARVTDVIHVSQMLGRRDLIALIAAGNVFVTPSIYEPLGIVNLEAMALGMPVVATATGGIPDVVVDGQTGLLVPIEQVNDGSGTPTNPSQFESDLAERITELLNQADLAERMGQAGHRRAEELFTWQAVGRQTMAVYEQVMTGRS